jgi:hypothetical protein
MRRRSTLAAALPTLFLVLGLTGVATWLTPAAPLAACTVAAPVQEPVAAAAAAIEDSAPVAEEEPATLPETLSALGLFTRLDRLAPAEGVERYEVRFPLWIDGARIVRHHRLPPEPIRTDADGNFSYPVGSLFAQTILNPRDGVERPVETRVFWKTAERWLAGAYVWSERGDEAKLSGTIDRTVETVLPGAAARHVVPGRIACLQCHAGDQEPVLGFTPLQLGRDEVRRLEGAGRLENAERAVAAAEFASYSDSEREALGYLAGNCAHCHRPGSSSFVPAELDLRPDRIHAAIGREAYRLQGDDARRVIVPGDPQASTLFRLFERSLSDGHDAVKRMPPIGNQAVDPKGREALRRWIAELSPAMGSVSR